MDTEVIVLMSDGKPTTVYHMTEQAIRDLTELGWSEDDTQPYHYVIVNLKDWLHVG